MSIKIALVHYLLSQAAVKRHVGTRIFWGQLPQGQASPAITCEKVGGTPTAHQGGAASAASSRIQVSCWSKSPKEAEAVKEAVRLSLVGFQGNLGPPGGQVAVLMIEHAGDYDGFEADRSGGPGGINEVAIDLNIWHRQPVPSF